MLHLCNEKSKLYLFNVFISYCYVYRSWIETRHR
jgi:hypothetical protein